MNGIREGPWTKWGLIIGVIGVVLTLISLALAFPSSQSSQSFPPTSPSSQISNNHSISGSTPSSTPNPSVYWKGTVIIGHGVWLDFDANPPSQEISSASVWYNPFQLNAGGDIPNTVLLALWNQSSSPTAARCREWVATHSSGYVAIDTGEKVCIKTLQGRYGLLQVTSADTNQMGATVTIWNL